jgi:acyl carrier protein
MRPPTSTHISEWLIIRIAQMLDKDKDAIDPEVTFSRLGLDSTMSIELLVGLEEWLGVQLDPGLIFDHPTVVMLSTKIASSLYNRQGIRPSS